MLIWATFLKFLRITSLWFSLTGAALAGTGAALAADVTVAVASNFLTTADEIAARFQTETGHQVHIINGSTGTLYAQIINGAPYDLFLSADQERVRLLAAAGKLLDARHKPYAVGGLVLYARKSGILNDDIASSLNAEHVHHFAMADPALAPYGRAASQVLTHLQLPENIRQKAVFGANIGQTFGFVQTGNAPVGFVARAQALKVGGDWLDVPTHYHAAIIQEVGLLAHADDNAAALAFYAYLSRADVQAMLPAFGYQVPQ